MYARFEGHHVTADTRRLALNEYVIILSWVLTYIVILHRYR